MAGARTVPALVLSAAAPTGGDHTAQIIVALIGALALVLVALVPALINRSQKRDATTTPSPPGTAGATPDEMARVWKALEEVRRDARRHDREHAGYDALLDECRRDGNHLGDELARLRDTVTRHVARPTHDGDR